MLRELLLGIGLIGLIILILLIALLPLLCTLILGTYITNIANMNTTSNDNAIYQQFTAMLNSLFFILKPLGYIG